MKDITNKNYLIKCDEYRDNHDVETIALHNAIVVSSGGAFKNCTNLREVFFGVDISRIGHGTFANCTSLTDVWFPIIDEGKIIEIANDAFRGCPNKITFHIFATALKNKYLNEYAKKHGFKVVGMI